MAWHSARAESACRIHVSTHVPHCGVAQNARIVPVKVLKGHKSSSGLGVLHSVFHPTQPWLFTAGADGRILLYTNIHG
jgi:ribosome biogenesis protein ERB1